MVYDLERRVLLWVGEDRTEEAVQKFFTEEMGRRRCPTLQVVCMDLWAPYANLVREHAVNAQILFDRFHIVKHLNEAVDAARRELWRQLASKERASFKGTRWLLLKNPWNVNSDQKERLSTLVRWNTPLVRAWYLKESFQPFWGYQQPWRAKQYLLKWMHSAMRFEAGTIPEICAHAPISPGWRPRLNQDPAFQWRRRGHAQQDQVHQSSLFRVSQCQELHRSHLSLLRPTAAAR